MEPQKDSQEETTIVVPAYGRSNTDAGVKIENNSGKDVMAILRDVVCIDVNAAEIKQTTEKIGPLPGVDPNEIIHEKEQQIQHQKHKMEQQQHQINDQKQQINDQKQQINDHKKQIYKLRHINVSIRQELEELRKSCLVSEQRHNELKQMIFKYHKNLTSEVVQLFPEISKKNMEPSSSLPSKKRSRATSAPQVKEPSSSLPPKKRSRATSAKPKANSSSASSSQAEVVSTAPQPEVVSTEPQDKTSTIKKRIEACLLEIKNGRSEFLGLEKKTRYFGPVYSDQEKKLIQEVRVLLTEWNFLGLGLSAQTIVRFLIEMSKKHKIVLVHNYIEALGLSIKVNHNVQWNDMFVVMENDYKKKKRPTAFAVARLFQKASRKNHKIRLETNRGPVISKFKRVASNWKINSTLRVSPNLMFSLFDANNNIMKF